MTVQDYFKEILSKRFLYTSWENATLPQIPTYVADAINLPVEMIKHDFNGTGSEISLCFSDQTITFHIDWKCSGAYKNRIVMGSIC